MIDLSGIRNIIFDYGGVIINIDFKLTINAFKKLGFLHIEEIIFQGKGSELLLQMEKGELSHEEFYNEVRRLSGLKITNKEIEKAWNALLLEMPDKRIKTLEKLKSNYRIFLLSNTNSIHYEQYAADLKNKYGYSDFNKLFEKAWFSFDLGMAKPNPDIFHFVLKDAGLNPSQTLYIDDLEKNVLAAEITGMKGHFLRPDEDISGLF
jgi:putative hydrolase of the HAD superfamily